MYDLDLAEMYDSDTVANTADFRLTIADAQVKADLIMQSFDEFSHFKAIDLCNE